MNKKTAFLQMFGDSPMLRVMDFLIVNEDFDYLLLKNSGTSTGKQQDSQCASILKKRK